MTGRVASLPGGNLWALVLRLLLLLLVKATIGSPGSSIQPVEKDFLENSLPQEDHRHNEVDVSSALREFQWLSHLPVTGNLDSPTLQRMSALRCAVKDAGGQRAWARLMKRVLQCDAAPGGQHRRSKRYAPGDRGGYMGRGGWVGYKMGGRDFHRLSHLPVTGHLDCPTLQWMSALRCAVKDAEGQRAWARLVDRVLLCGAAPGGQHRRSKRNAPEDHDACGWCWGYRG